MKLVDTISIRITLLLVHYRIRKSSKHLVLIELIEKNFFSTESCVVLFFFLLTYNFLSLRTLELSGIYELTSAELSSMTRGRPMKNLSVLCPKIKVSSYLIDGIVECVEHVDTLLFRVRRFS